MVGVIRKMELKPEASVNSLWNNSDCSSNGDKLNVNLFHVFSRRTHDTLGLTGGCRNKCQVFCLDGAFPSQLQTQDLGHFLHERGNQLQTRRDILLLVQWSVETLPPRLSLDPQMERMEQTTF